MVKINGIKMTDKIDTTLTQDLFGVENCSNCDGSGTVIKKFIFNDIFPMPISESEEDCDICKGSGVKE